MRDIQNKIALIIFISTIMTSWPSSICAAVIGKQAEVKNSPQGETTLLLNVGTGVEVLETVNDWAKIRFRVTNPAGTLDGDFIKPHSSLCIFVQDFKYTEKYPAFGKTLKTVKLEKFPMGPPTQKSGYVIGYTYKTNLTAPRVENAQKISNLKPGHYFRQEYVNFKNKTFDVGAAGEEHPVFCDVQVSKGKNIKFEAGNFIEFLNAFEVDGKGNIKGDTCFETFCIEKLTIEGSTKFSAFVSGVKQTFVLTENMKEFSSQKDDF
jgi:hypothetical protein